MHVDWLEWSLSSSQTPLTAAPAILGFPWSERHGANGYKRAWAGPAGVLVMADGTDQMGTHVVMPAGAIARAAAAGGDAASIIAWVHQHHGKVTRLDVACDWYSQTIDPRTLHMWDRLGLLTHSSQGAGTLTEDRKGGGVTCTWGRRGRRTFVRCYDKLAEKKLVPMPENDVPSFWTRVEWEFRQPTSDRLARAWVAGDVGQVRRAMVTALALRDGEAAHDPLRMSKAPLAPVWKQLLEGEPGPRPDLIKPEPTSWEDCERYLQEQVAPMLAAYLDSHPDPAAAVGELLTLGRQRRNDKHIGIMATGPAGVECWYDERPDGEWLG